MWHVQRMMMGGQVKRYHTWPIGEQNVGCHSWGVAMIVQRLWPDCRKELLLAALQHDMGEQEMGDVPAPAKWRAPQFFAHLNEAEAGACLDMGFLPYEAQLTDHERRVLKLADILELCVFARYCVNCGQESAQIVWENGQRYTLKLLQDSDPSAPGVVEASALLEEVETWLALERAEALGEPKKPLKAKGAAAGKYLEPTMANVGRPGEMPPVSHAMPYGLSEKCLCGGIGCNRCEPQGRG